jgi:Ca2+-binding RTX toxin-like protein
MSAYVGTLGNDYFSVLPETTQVDMRDGNDVVRLPTPNGPTVNIDLGAGDDEIDIVQDYGAQSSDVTLTLGAGRDLISIYQQRFVIKVTDFQVGAGGDVIDFRYHLEQWVNGWDNHSNPFAMGGYLRLVQRGADAVLQIDAKPFGVAGDWQDWYVLQNIAVTALTADNFKGAAPDGSAPVPIVVQGTSAADVLEDGWGADFLHGGDGNDTLTSGVGDDHLEGGAGNDFLEDRTTGSDTLIGGAGDDTLQTLHSDAAPGLSRDVILDGGDGNDWMVASNYSQEGALTATGGAGDDLLSFGTFAHAIVDMGSGTDIVIFDPSGSHDITLGSGADTIEVVVYEQLNYAPSYAPTHVRDFLAGKTGDRLDLLARVAYKDWDEVSNLVTGHYLQFTQVDGSTTVKIDPSGHGAWQFTIILDNVALADLTPFNLGMHVDGAPLTGVQVNSNGVFDGGAGDDILVALDSGVVHGKAGDDRIEGGASYDSLYGDEGADVLIGAAGADNLYGGDGDDMLDGGSGADQLNGGNGLDMARYDGSGAAVNISLASHIATGGDAQGDTLVGIESLAGSTFGDTLSGDAGGNVLLGLGGNDTLVGDDGGDTLDGGDGADQLYGGGDNDYLIGGAGYDFARYDNSSAMVVNLVTGLGGNGEAAGDVLSGIEGVVGSGAGDSMLGDAGANSFYGMVGKDTLAGGGGNDDLWGGDGDDMLIGGTGADVLQGGAGYDYASYEDSAAGVTVNLATGLGSGGDAAGDVLTSIEGVDGSNQNDLLLGGDGFDVLRGLKGADVLYGRGGEDSLWGGDGDDHLYGGLGGDTLVGGAGFDFARYDQATAGVSVNLLTGQGLGGEAMEDDLTSVEGLVGSEYADTLIGGGTDNTLYGLGGNDILMGGLGGGDTLDGGAGDDHLYGGTQNDYVTGGAGYDFARYDNAAAGWRPAWPPASARPARRAATCLAGSRGSWARRSATC